MAEFANKAKFADCTALKESDKALLCEIEGEERWGRPKSPLLSRLSRVATARVLWPLRAFFIWPFGKSRAERKPTPAPRLRASIGADGGAQLSTGGCAVEVEVLMWR